MGKTVKGAHKLFQPKWDLGKANQTNTGKKHLNCIDNIS